MVYAFCAFIAVAGEDMKQPIVVGQFGVLSLSVWNWTGLMSGSSSLVRWPLEFSFMDAEKRVIELVVSVLIGAGGLLFGGVLTILVVEFQVFLFKSLHVVAVLPGMADRSTGFAVFGTWPLHSLFVCSCVMVSLATVPWAPFVPAIIGMDLQASTGLWLRSWV